MLCFNCGDPLRQNGELDWRHDWSEVRPEFWAQLSDEQKEGALTLHCLVDSWKKHQQEFPNPNAGFNAELAE